MSDFIKKIKDDAKAVGAAIDNELTVLEGVPGYDPLADPDTENSDTETGDTGTGEARDGAADRPEAEADDKA